MFDWGIDGAAFATIVAQGVAFIYGVYLSVSHKQIPFSRPSLPKVEERGGKINTWTRPPSWVANDCDFGRICTAIMSVVTSFGSDAVSGFGAAQRLESMIMLPAQALGTSVNSMAGQNIAVGKWRRVHKITLYATILNLVTMLLIALLIFVIGGWGIRLFISEPGAVHFGTDYIKMVAFFFPFLGFNFVWNGVVRASGAAFQVLVLNLISFWILRFPLTWMFAQYFGEKGIAYGLGSSFVISSVVAFGYYRFGRWSEKELLKDASARSVES